MCNTASQLLTWLPLHVGKARPAGAVAAAEGAVQEASKEPAAAAAAAAVPVKAKAKKVPRYVKEALKEVEQEKRNKAAAEQRPPPATQAVAAVQSGKVSKKKSARQKSKGKTERTRVANR